MNKKNTLTYSAIIFSMLFWSFSFVWVKIAYESFRPLTVVVLRLAISSVLLWTVGLNLKRIQIIQKKDFKYILLITFFEPFLYFLGESYGMDMVSSITGSVIISTIPIFTLIFAYFIYHENLTKINIIGMIVSFLGVFIIIFNKNLKFTASPLGIALMFLAVFSAVGYTLLLKKISEKYNPLTIIAYQNFYGIFCFAPLFFVFDYKQLMETVILKESLFALVYLAIFASSLSFIFFTYGLKHLGISKASIFSNLIPVFTAIYAYFRLDEMLSDSKIAGILITVCGLFISQIRKRKKYSSLHTG